MGSKVSVRSSLVLALLAGNAAVSQAQVRGAAPVSGPVMRGPSVIGRNLPSNPMNTNGGLLTTPLVNPFSMTGPLKNQFSGGMPPGKLAPSAEPLVNSGLYPAATDPDLPLVAAPPSDGQLPGGIVADKNFDDGGALPASSRGALEFMASAAPENISALFNGSNQFGSPTDESVGDGLSPQNALSGTNFFSGPLRPAPAAARKSETHKTAIDLSPLTPNFVVSMGTAMDARVLSAAEALLQKLKLIKADLRLFINAIGGLRWMRLFPAV